MKITQKFLLFGAIPALVQAGIFVQMFSLLGSVEYYAEKEVKQGQIARTLVAAMAQSVEVAVASAAYAAKPMDELAQRIAQASERADKTFAELRQETMEDPKTRAELEELISIGSDTKRDFFVLKQVVPPSNLSEDSPLKDIDIEKLRSGQAFFRRVRKLTAILDRQNIQLEEVRKQQTAKHAEVARLVWAELILSLVVITILYVLFRYDFGRRFNNLLEIAHDLAIDKPLRKTMSGNDELSELSAALITAAEARREAVAEKQMLFQMVTHDLRSPLMAASIVVETLLRDIAGPAEQRQKRLLGMERSLHRVVGLTNDLLTIEQLSAGGLEITRAKVDFQETAEKAVETVRPLAEHKKCSVVSRSPSLVVSIDEDRVLQISINLLANAIKFSPPGETVELTAATEGNRLRVEVLDRGPGISDKDVKKLFNPFKQGNDDQNAAGFGLGLAIAKKLVDLHDGTMGARLREGGGSIFWFTLRI